MLELRPNCECCDKDLPVNSTEAYICTYECTFCKHCVETVLENVCPNCGGGFTKRPIRPSREYRPEISAQHQKPSTQRVNTQYSKEDMRSFAQTIKHIEPKNR